MKLSHITSLFLLFLTAIAASNAPKPHIIYILADDMGYSDMGFQNSPIKTPNLDKLREGGMFLERNYVQPQCSPSRVAFLTGRYPYRYGLHEHIVLSNSLTGIPGRTKTIAETMKDAGYRTSIIGKWHVGGRLQSYLPHHQGFDHSFLCINGAISYWNYTHQGFSDIIRNGEKYYAPSLENNEDSGNPYVTDLWGQEAVDVIKGHDGTQPLFMYLAFTAPHHPLQAPETVLERYPEDAVGDYWSGPDADPRRNARNRKYYMAMVEAMDSAVGRVVEALEKRRMLENTLIVFSSDNGGIIEADNRPLRSIKGDSFEGGVRVPGIAFWSGKIEPGSTSSELVYIADWYATFAELAGVSVKEEQLDSVSAVRVLEGKSGKRKAVPIISAGRHAYITDDYSLVGGGEDYQLLLDRELSGFQLYDLNTDISQEQAITAERRRVADGMRKKLAEHLRDVNRGYFNWDIRYSSDRLKARQGDHSMNNVVNDLPAVTVNTTAEGTAVTVSPVSGELVYRLLGCGNGGQEVELDRFVCRTDAESHTFTDLAVPTGIQEFRIKTAHHFGLPTRESFSLYDAYAEGALADDSECLVGREQLPEMDGFLPICDLSGGKSILIVDENLAYADWSQEGGLLHLCSDPSVTETFLTRYFVEPHSRGKIYAAMLVQFSAMEAECVGQINWLRQNGWNGPTAQLVSLSFESDGIYLDHTDTVRRHPRQRLAGYDGKVVCVVFAFEFGTTASDTLRVYLNPAKDLNSLTSAATFGGEFTFDRLQFKLTGRTGSQMNVDEIRIGTSLSDVLF